MRWVVTGAAGQLGSDVVAQLTAADHDEVTGLDRGGLDITDPAAVDAVLSDRRPDVVVNCAAYTAVDAAETDEPAATAVNATGPAYLAEACRRTGVRLLHVSTDYVFDGTATRPIPEDAPIAPRSTYGGSKAAGERAVIAAGGAGYVVRTAWVYGRIGGNFVKTMLTLARDRDRLDVVDDQRGAPTWSADLAAALIALGRADSSACPPGLWHFTNSDDTTWCGFAREILRTAGLPADKVQPTTTAAFPRPAPRPAYSVLDLQKWRAHPLPDPRPWQQALREALPQIEAQLLAEL